MFKGNCNKENMNNVQNVFQLKTGIQSVPANELEDIVRLLNIISLRSKREINSLESQLKYMNKKSLKAQGIQAKINNKLHRWTEKVKRVGASPLGVFRCRIATNDGTYLWEYPKQTAELI